MKLGREPKDLAATTAEPHPPAGGAPGTATPVGSPRPATAYAETGSRPERIVQLRENEPAPEGYEIVRILDMYRDPWGDLPPLYTVVVRAI